MSIDPDQSVPTRKQGRLGAGACRSGYNHSMATNHLSFILPTPTDFSFQETVSAHGWRRLAPFVWNETDRTLERVEELPTGVVLIQMSSAEKGVQVKVQNEELEEKATEKEIVRRVRRMLQIDLSLEEFHAYCRTSPSLSHIAECRRGRMLRSPTLYEDALKVIATSNTTWAQTIAMTGRLVQHFGTSLPQFPERRAFPTPERIAAVSFEEFAAKARMGYRNQFVYRLSAAVASGELDLEGWQSADWPAAELRKRLLSLQGIGPYGAACLMLYLGQPEHVNADSVARAALSQELGRPVTDKEVHAFFAPHGAWRGLVYNFYPWTQAKTS